MKYEIAHELRLTYSAPVWEHHVEVRVTPQDNAHQRLLASAVDFDPTCEALSYRDCFGNRVHYCSLIAPHDHLTVRVHARLDTSLNNPFDYDVVAPARETDWVAESLRAQPRLWDYVLHRSAATPDLTRLAGAELALPTRQSAHPLLDSIMAALDWMGDLIDYTPGFTPAPAKLEEVLTRRVGGCQDLAHLLISIVRWWGFPARYVLGYQDPGYAVEEEDEQRPHAWAEILLPGAGWRGVDPTTRLVANHTYIAVAVGRDANDAMPIKDVFKGGEATDAAQAETAVLVEVTRDQ